MEIAKLGKNTIIEDCKTALSKKKVSEDDADIFRETVQGVLDDYGNLLGSDQEIRYKVRKRIDKVECNIFIKADRLDPFEEGQHAEERALQRSIGNLQFNRDTSLSYRYLKGYNVITIRSARKRGSGNILKQPMIQAALGGLILGLLCQQLPGSINQFIVNEITSPVLSIVLNMISGIMGPVVFITIVKAVGLLDSIDDLTGLGSRIMLRFLISAACVAFVVMLIGICFFPLFGKGGVDISPAVLIELLLDVIPTSLVTPFVENNYPQLVVLALGLGAVLLTLGDRVNGLMNLIEQLAEWLIGFMNTVLIIMPVVPFLSIFNLIAKGQISTFLKGWKFILASYVCMVVCIAVKLIKVSLKCKISIPLLWKKTKPVIMKVFSTASSASVIKMNYEMSRDELGIDPAFSSFWVPLSSGMLDASSTMFFVLAPFFVAELTGMHISVAFLFVVMLLAVELSMANPGLTAGYTIIFQALGMSAEHVGMFSAFSVVIRNFSAAICTAYRILEHIEVAWKTGHIDMSYFDKEAGPQEQNVAKG